MAENLGDALSNDLGSPGVQAEDAVNRFWQQSKPQIQPGERLPWNTPTYKLSQEVMSGLLKCLEGYSGRGGNAAFIDAKQQINNHLKVFFEACGYAENLRPGRRKVRRTDGSNEPVGPFVIATPPKDPDGFAAVVAARMLFSKKIFQVEKSVIRELMKEAMKSLYDNIHDDGYYEGTALEAVRLLERVDPTEETSGRTVQQTNERFELLTEWFKDFVVSRHYRCLQFDFLATMYITVEMVLWQNGNLTALLQGYNVLDHNGDMQAYDEWGQEPNFELLKERIVPGPSMLFSRMTSDVEKQILGNVANGAADPDYLWREIANEKTKVEASLQGVLNILTSEDITYDVVDVMAPQAFDEHLSLFETMYNLKNAKVRKEDEQKLKVNLFLTDVLKQYFLQLLVASQLINITQLLKRKLRGDHANIKTMFADICTIDERDPQESELKQLISYAAREGPGMDFYQEQLEEKRKELSPTLKEVIKTLISEQKTVLNRILCVEQNPIDLLEVRGLLENGFLVPAVRITAEVTTTTVSRPEIESKIMGDTTGDGGEGGTIQASDQAAPDALGNMGGLIQGAEAGASYPKEPGPSEKPLVAPARQLEPLPNVQGRGLPNLTTPIDRPAATNELPTARLDEIATSLQDETGTEHPAGWIHFSRDDDISPGEHTLTNHAANNGTSRNLSTGGNVVQRLMGRFQGT